MYPASFYLILRSYSKKGRVNSKILLELDSILSQSWLELRIGFTLDAGRGWDFHILESLLLLAKSSYLLPLELMRKSTKSLSMTLTHWAASQQNETDSDCRMKKVDPGFEEWCMVWPGAADKVERIFWKNDELKQNILVNSIMKG